MSSNNIIPYELSPEKLSAEKIAYLKNEAEIYGYNNGLLMFDTRTNLPYLCPFTLFPRQTPRLVYDKMWNVQELMQELYAKVANSHDFLLTALKPMTLADPFLKMLVDTLEQNKYRINDPICLISRSDYMIHENDYNTLQSPQTATTTTTTNNDEIIINNIGYTPLQVEFNSISVSFSALGNTVNNLHKYLLQSHSPLIQNISNNTHNNPDVFTKHDGSLGAANTLFEATKLMVKKFSKYSTPQEWVVIMVIQPGESNVADQRLIEYELLQTFGIRLIRATLYDIEKNVIFPQDSVEEPPLWGNNEPISVIYYRSCYTPTTFEIIEGENELSENSKKLINVYQKLEKSNAIKCPNIGLHLAGTKKIQQLLTQRDILKQFIHNDNDCEQLLGMFTNIYSLQNDDLKKNKTILEYAKQNPSEFVLKPMREGGGNNYYDDELRQFLITADDENGNNKNELNAMVLMSRISPNVSTKSYFLRRGELYLTESVSEYGIFGGFIGYVDQIDQNYGQFGQGLITLYNKPFGSLIRIKAVGVNEGGVVAGFSCLSSPILD
jgi:glutathione synthase